MQLTQVAFVFGGTYAWRWLAGTAKPLGLREVGCRGGRRRIGVWGGRLLVGFLMFAPGSRYAEEALTCARDLATLSQAFVCKLSYPFLDMLDILLLFVDLVQ